MFSQKKTKKGILSSSDSSESELELETKSSNIKNDFKSIETKKSKLKEHNYETKDNEEDSK